MTIAIMCEAMGDTALALTAQARKMAPGAYIIILWEESGYDPALYGALGADEAVTLSVAEDDCAQAERVAEALRAIAPDAVLFPATIRGRFLSAWTAAKLKTGLTADCTELAITEDGLLKQIRPAFGGNLMAEILCRVCRPQMASIRPGVFPVPEIAQRKPIPVKVFASDESIPIRLQRLAFEPAERGVSLQSAKAIVTGGKGIGGKEGFSRLAELAELLGGAVGATRSAVDAGWIGYEHQIGQTGMSVRPELYIAVGVSGCIQHTVGMSGSGVVLAINKDRNAPIFACADYGVVSDWQEAVDEMIDDLKERKRQE